MYADKQRGKGMIAFLAGSVVALAAIAVMLFTLNSNHEAAFKQPELASPQKPEVLTPNNAPSVPQAVEPATTVAGTQYTPAASVAKTIPVQPVETASSVMAKSEGAANGMALEHTAPSAASVVAAPVVKAKPVEKKSVAKEPVQAKTESKDIKPTAQQILDSGNLEKAQAMAQKAMQERMAQTGKNTKAAEKPRLKAEEQSTKKSVPTANTARSVSIQAGAYSNKQAAENQKAKLALMGVMTQVVPVQSGGKTVYRVQTSRLNGEQADTVQQTLQKNGINTYIQK